jgi:succinyl-diaminopimelate desuccinylase
MFASPSFFDCSAPHPAARGATLVRALAFASPKPLHPIVSARANHYARRMQHDPLPLAQALIRAPSVTPHDHGVSAILAEALAEMGFAVTRKRFGEVENLYARLGEGRPNFCFAGHLDVVPAGDIGAWRFDPFSATVDDGWLYGRGAADMKAAIAAMAAGVGEYLHKNGRPPGAISFLITLDEEGPAIDGTIKMLEAIHADGEVLDHCLVGEPTSVTHVGDMIKHGRRGSLNAVITVTGKQGHVAYPKLALNPMNPLLDLLNMLRTRMLDSGAPGFDPSNLEVTTIDVGNVAHNVIPARAVAKMNIRFNTRHTGESLLRWIEECRMRVAKLYPNASILIEPRVGAEPFMTPAGPFTDTLRAAVRDETGLDAALSTTGGTSDARYIRHYCHVAEFGVQNETAHMVNERVRIEDVRTLAKIYRRVLERYFNNE